MLDRDRVKELCLPFLRQYLESRGVKIKPSGVLFCPFHKNTNTPAACLYEKDAHPHIQCFGACDKSYDIFDAIGFFEGLTDFKEIVKFAAHFCGVDINSVGGGNRRHNAPAKNNAPDAWKKGFNLNGGSVTSVGGAYPNPNRRHNAPAKNNAPDAWKKGFNLNGGSVTSVGGAYPKNQIPIPTPQSEGTLGADNAPQSPTIARQGVFLEKPSVPLPDPQNRPQSADNAPQSEPAQEPAQNSEWGTVKLGQPRPVDFDVTGLGDEFHF